ncbi:hypothetical protein NVP1238A_03 [Vibrio phage 1.238.A._10N.261.52.F10]|uniref:Uncharacterized protein n=1 Tax=Vibrio phage 1.238.A._10N.261.52.F10 TaxID=1881231 RepID=A0A2I7RUA7_9CAUD|nr:hypothetical protein KNT79_gp03 [Vibrio phage 1.238.A._10N.261.52.F10]AUR97252.1 hypothetical protein NVP1238A_03 [Vibrio phage 1.238.A._10N.261.52.F10]AUR97346.1 hypothetical protein NVP1238B_04 [Vibrio phage 1.238.B._10N.261.52.F10]
MSRLETLHITTIRIYQYRRIFQHRTTQHWITRAKLNYLATGYQYWLRSFMAYDAPSYQDSKLSQILKAL